MEDEFVEILIAIVVLAAVALISLGISSSHRDGNALNLNGDNWTCTEWIIPSDLNPPSCMQYTGNGPSTLTYRIVQTEPVK